VTRLAAASVRGRRAGFLATFLAVFLGASIVMAFASMLDTAGGVGVSAADRSTLTVMTSVVGGWGAIIVASAIVTTLSVATRQRATELALLRSVGATPAQVVRLMLGEVLIVASAAIVLALPVGFGGGAALVHILGDSGQIADNVQYRFGGAALGMGIGETLLAALAATWLTARRTARRQVREALLDAAIGARRMSRTRWVAGIVALSGGISCAVVTAAVLDGAKLESQAVAAEGAILSGIGFALLAPPILTVAAAVLGPLLRLLGGPAAQLGLLRIRQRTQQAATPMMPIIVCTAIAVGTLYLQSIWNAGHHVSSADDRSTETLNFVVVGMIAVFAAVMLVNLLVADLAGRRREFAQLRLLGATPRQVLRLVGSESALMLTVGLFFGTAAALLTVVPYSSAVSGKVVPDAPVVLYLSVVAAVILLTLVASLAAASRITRTPAIAAVQGSAA
jgi:putative ABC transport system permease protein